MRITDKTAAIVLEKLAMALLVIFVYLIIFSGLGGVITHPQYAYFSNPIEVYETASINEQPQKVKLNLKGSKPKPFLLGVEEIIFELQTSEGALTYHIHEEDLIRSWKSGKMHFLKNENFNFNVANDFPDHNSEYCNSEIISDKSDAKGTLQINTIKRNLKKIQLEGEIQVEGVFVIDSSCPIFPELVKETKDIYVSTAKIPFDLESRIIFEWNSKGASKYRI